MRLLPLLLACGLALPSAAKDALPHILWLTTEDNGPQLGCYGDDFATTPNIDALAAKGMIYRLAWSNAAVCAPARTTIISGLFPPATGSQHMRSYVTAPADQDFYPTFLKRVGYYVTNNHKEDYSLSQPDNLWDDSSRTAHYQNRPDGSPFFAIFNFTVSHESQVRLRPHELVHDPAKVDVPPYQPDDPLIRRDWAQFYDKVSEADAQCGEKLAELAAAGLEEDTIVFYYGDHGAGIASHKRNPMNRGLQVALVIYIPVKFAHLRPDDYTVGGSSDRLVSFVDLAPTVLSLAGIKPPAWMHGSAFLGEHIGPAPATLFGFRGRADERVDFVRSLTDGRYVYIRNFRPDLPAGQYVEYQFRTPGNQRWRELFLAGETNGMQSAFFEPTPPEQLFDLQEDPHETINLADDPAHAAVKARLAGALSAQMRSIRDLGFLPEAELHRRTAGIPPYAWSRIPGNYDYDHIEAVADQATRGVPLPPETVAAQLQDPEPAIRYWTLRGLRYQQFDSYRAKVDVIHAHLDTVRERLTDESPDVVMVAADLLVRYGNRVDRRDALELLAKMADPTGDFLVALTALGMLDNLGEVAKPVHPILRDYPLEGKHLPHSRYGRNFGKLMSHTLSQEFVDPHSP